VGAIVFMALSVLFGAYVLATEGLTVAIAGAIGGMAGSISALIGTSYVPRYVENWDNEHPSATSE
jgi:hypothetical protein